MQQNDVCQHCHQKSTAPIYEPVFIYHDFDATGQEFDPICTDEYDIVGFELHCPTCKYELYELRKAEERLKAEEESGDLPY